MFYRLVCIVAISMGLVHPVFAEQKCSHKIVKTSEYEVKYLGGLEITVNFLKSCEGSTECIVEFLFDPPEGSCFDKKWEAYRYSRVKIAARSTYITSKAKPSSQLMKRLEKFSPLSSSGTYMYNPIIVTNHEFLGVKAVFYGDETGYGVKYYKILDTTDIFRERVLSLASDIELDLSLEEIMAEVEYTGDIDDHPSYQKLTNRRPQPIRLIQYSGVPMILHMKIGLGSLPLSDFTRVLDKSNETLVDLLRSLKLLMSEFDSRLSRGDKEYYQDAYDDYTNNINEMIRALTLKNTEPSFMNHQYLTTNDLFGEIARLFVASLNRIEYQLENQLRRKSLEPLIKDISDVHAVIKEAYGMKDSLMGQGSKYSYVATKILRDELAELFGEIGYSLSPAQLKAYKSVTEKLSLVTSRNFVKQGGDLDVKVQNEIAALSEFWNENEAWGQVLQIIANIDPGPLVNEDSDEDRYLSILIDNFRTFVADMQLMTGREFKMPIGRSLQ